MVKIDRDPLMPDDDDLAFQEAQRRREEEAEAQSAPLPEGKGDLVLRLALMKAGVITDEQITEAEQWVGKAREAGRVLMLAPDSEGVLQWQLLTMADLQRALGNAVVPT